MLNTGGVSDPRNCSAIGASGMQPRHQPYGLAHTFQVRERMFADGRHGL